MYRFLKMHFKGKTEPFHILCKYDYEGHNLDEEIVEPAMRSRSEARIKHSAGVVLKTIHLTRAFDIRHAFDLIFFLFGTIVMLRAEVSFRKPRAC